MKSKIQREQKTTIVFQKQKKPKVPNFQENSLAFQLRTVGKYGASWNMGNEDFIEPLMEAQKEGAKKRERGR